MVNFLANFLTVPNYLSKNEKLKNAKITCGQKKWANGQFLEKKWAEKFAKNGQKTAKNGQNAPYLV